MDPDKSATWYRNHIPLGYALVLMFNRRTSDAQSLKDIYPVTESLLTVEGLDHLIRAAFRDFQPNAVQVQILRGFITRLQRGQLGNQVVPQPQLRDLAEFLRAVNSSLALGKANVIEDAIVQALPHLGLFRCNELATVLNSPRGDRLLRDLYRAARLGSEILDERQQGDYLTCLGEAEFDDESAFGGPNPDEKRAALRRLLTEIITDRVDLLHILQLDWHEVSPVLFKKARKTPEERLRELGHAIEAALEQQHLEPADLPEYDRDVLQDLADGHEPDAEPLDRLIADYRDTLGKGLSNKLRRLSGAKSRSHSDFIAGLVALAIELLIPLQDDLQSGTCLHVTFNADRLDEMKQKETEALAAFRVLYGGVERALSSVRWDLEQLWGLAADHSDIQTEESEDEREREKVSRAELHFRVTVQDIQGNDLAHADLIWQYRSDSPAATTLTNLLAERERLDQKASLGPLFVDGDPALPIPLYNTCPVPEDIGDLDLRRPLHSLGAWYKTPGNLRETLRMQLEHRVQPDAWATIERALAQLEQAWGRVVDVASTQGILAADIEGLLAAYDSLLSSAVENWQSGQEAAYGYRVLTQAWIVGPKNFDEWAVVPFLHPLKLYWWRERTRCYDGILRNLLNPDMPATAVDEVRLRRELVVTYGSAGFPAVLALPPRDGWPELFLPVDEADGYELYRRSSVAGVAYGLDLDLVSEAESEAVAQNAAEVLANVVQDYIETYPFVRDGVEIYLMQCRNGALPVLMVERLARLAERRKWTVRMSVVVHTTDRGAPLFRRVTEWLKAHEEFVHRPAGAYFPLVTLQVLECAYGEFIRQVRDADIIILPDVLAERGHHVDAELTDAPPSDAPLDGYVAVYRAQQEPFERGEYSRSVLLNPLPQPTLVRHFYNVQWAAQKRRPVTLDKTARFHQVFTLQEWERELAELHHTFNWVTCYDTAVDRFLLEDTFPDTVQVIRYSLGLGIKRRHNLTVSSSYQAQDVVVRRLTTRLNELLPGTPDDFRQEVARRLVTEAKQVSGDIVLRAAGPGAYLNELIGLVLAKHLTEQRYLAEHPGALTTWIYLDDFAHWFGGQLPDLLFVAIPPEANGELPLHLEVVETKCVGQANFAAEAASAQRQTMQGVNRLAPAWTPSAHHLDALYWYDQLYRAVVGNLAVERDRMRLWEAFRHRVPLGEFTLDLSGNSWVYCYDGTVGMASGQAHEDRSFDFVAPDAPDCILSYHHYGRFGLRQALRDLVEGNWKIQSPPDTWLSVHDEPLPTLPTSEPSRVVATPLPSTEVLVVAASGLELTEVSPERVLGIDPAWIQSKAHDLERALHQYKIQVYPVEPELADVGPSVVRFKLRLRQEQISKLQRIANDLARELALISAPIIGNVPGTHYVGVDLPRPQPEILRLGDALGELPQAEMGELPFLVGKTPDGRTIIHDLAVLPHLLVAGTTGSGKTMLMYSLLVNLLHNCGPDALSLLLIDPKQTDFVYFEGLPHLLGGHVIIEATEAVTQLEQLMTLELPSRTEQLRQARCRDIHDYNQQHPDSPMRSLVVAIDEYAELLDTMGRAERNNFEAGLRRLAQRARNVGIRLVIATQRPSADIVTSSLKANLPARIAFRLPSHHDSMTVLDQPGAENLLGRGDMLVLVGGQVERAQGFYITTNELEIFLRKIHR